jgi:hypothetical protein
VLEGGGLSQPGALGGSRAAIQVAVQAVKLS